ncbi:hypothetical protein PQX77_019395 [Marasmius sp. AFHP31]|nr:hypothetical protein PQX77_019395 [Marasmius sp. AFHP31]
MSSTCGGCGKQSTLWGLRRHLSQTTNTPCIRYGDTLNIFNAYDLSESSMDSEGSWAPTDGSDFDNDTLIGGVDFDAEPQPFQGDYLGEDYTLHDLGQGDNMLLEQDAHDQFGDIWLGGAEGNVPRNCQDIADEEEEEVGDNKEDIEGELDDFDDDEMNAMWEDAWEPTQNNTTLAVDSDSDSDSGEEDVTHPTPSTRRAVIEDRLRQAPFVVHFGGQAGLALADGSREDADSQYRRALGKDGDKDSSFWFPFTSRVDWEVARWAKLRGPGANAFNEFLKIPGVVDSLALSFKTTQELNKIIDKGLPGRPAFRREEVVVAGEQFEFYHRDILECIRTLWGDPDLSTHLILRPERHYTDETLQTRLYHNMHTGDWWWATQEEVEKSNPGATIIPIIISSDKTQLTVFGNKTAYPVYISIGNIPKEIRRKTSRGAYLLLAYLPTSKLSHISNKSARRRALANLFHGCMGHVMEPLKTAGVEGIRVVDGAGVARRGHPVLAVYVADYPEQTLATMAKGNRCPGLCPTDPEELGDNHMNGPFLDLADALDVLLSIAEGPTTFTKKCKQHGMKPIANPFWNGLPYTNIFHSITPDILHQLYQGLIKHLIAWLIVIVGAAEIDARCRCFPPNHNIRLFLRGISGLSRVTGTEHQMIGRFLLGLIIDVRLPGLGAASSARLCAAVRGMLDFVYLAQYPLHTSETLQLLEEALSRFHEHKDVFVDLGACTGFRIPKLHGCQHYRRHFENFGTSDNYNTEYTERLHIDLAKNAYRATNHRDELPQMVLWLDRQEKLRRHTKFITAQLSGTPKPPLQYDIMPGVTFERTMKMAVHPTLKSVKFSTLEQDYGARHFHSALARYVTSIRSPHLTLNQHLEESEKLHLPFARVPVWHKVKWTMPEMYGLDSPSTVIVDSAHVTPARTNKRGHVVPGRFDTVLVYMGDEDVGPAFGVKGYRVGRVRTIFTLRQKQLDYLFQADEQEYVAKHLAYVEWFTTFSPRTERAHGLYKIARSVDPGSGYQDAIPDN